MFERKFPIERFHYETQQRWGRNPLGSTNVPNYQEGNKREVPFHSAVNASPRRHLLSWFPPPVLPLQPGPRPSVAPSPSSASASPSVQAATKLVDLNYKQHSYIRRCIDNLVSPWVSTWSSSFNLWQRQHKHLSVAQCTPL
jgi:hypothetical protein